MVGFTRLKPVSVRTGMLTRQASSASYGVLGRGNHNRWALRMRSLTVTLTAAISLSIALLVIQRSETSYLAPYITSLNEGLTRTVSPLIRLTEKPFKTVSSLKTSLSSKQALIEEKTQLEIQNQYLFRQTQSLQHLSLENHQLRQALKLASTPHAFHSAAKVTGHSYNGISSFLIISCEEGERIQKNSPVLSVKGHLIGRVEADSTTHARVMPVCNINSRIPVQVEDSRDHAILIGDQNLGLRVTHLEKSSQINVGKKLVTSGIGGVFPAGIPVAIITDIKGDTIKATPFAEINKLDYVVILQ